MLQNITKSPLATESLIPLNNGIAITLLPKVGNTPFVDLINTTPLGLSGIFLCNFLFLYKKVRVYGLGYYHHHH